MELSIECQKRAPGSKPNALRRSGFIPAVLYGHNGAESIELTLKAKDAEFLVRDASINNTLINVNIPDLSWNGKALLREIQAHPWKRHLYHLSFFSVATHGSVEVDVPLHFVGEPIGVKQGGGSVDVILTELHVKCAPGDIPDAISIDISGLNVGESLHVNQLNLPDGVVSTGEADRVVVTLLSGKGGDADANA